jgi:lysozyme
MKTSQKGLALIKEFEGFRSAAYRCPAGVLTIGYGHTSAAGDPQVTPNLVITKAVAEQILARDLLKYERAVESAVKVPLNQGQFDALVSLCYNIGPGAFAKSTLVRRLNAGRYQDVPAQLMRWSRANGQEMAGLVRRRRAEAALWRSLAEPESPVTAGRGDVSEVEEAQSEKPPEKSGSFWSIIVSVLTGGGLSLTGIDNLWAFLAVAVPLTMLCVVAFLIWRGDITIPGNE